MVVEAAVACTATSCANGEVCCTAVALNAVAACRAACPNNSAQICTMSSQCAVAGDVCMGGGGGGGGGGGVMTCRAVACTATSCTGGMICCTGVGGALDACQAGPMCPGASAQICATNADCQPPMVCRAAGGGGGGGGGGGLECRAPLPEAGPPPEAGVVDATTTDAEHADTGTPADAASGD
jgi:hypothetical protein